MGDMEATPMATVIKAMVMAAAKAMEETMAATRDMVAATGATRAMVAATEATRAMEEIGDMANSLTAAIKDMVSSLMAATKDMEGNRAVTITRATAREGMQRTVRRGSHRILLMIVQRT